MSIAMYSPGRLLMIAVGSLLLLGAPAAVAQLDPPTPALPQDGASGVALSARVLWRPVAAATTYELQVARDAAFDDLVFEDRTGEYELQVDGLWEETRYYWHVRSVDSLDSAGGWSATQSFTTIATGAPRPTTPLDGAAFMPMEQISLKFDFPTDPPSGFEVAYAFDPYFRSGRSIAVPASGRTATLTALPGDTTVYWRVRVAGGAAAGPGPWSRSMRFTTASPAPVRLGECDPINPPNGYTLVDLLVSSLWNGPSTASGAVRFRLEFGQDPAMREVMIRSGEIDNNALQVRLPAGSATWYWRVQAVSTIDGVLDGPWSVVSTFNVVERVETALDAPALLLPPNRSSTPGSGVVLVWDSVAGARSYSIEIGRDSTWEERDSTMTATGHSLRFTGLLPDTLYFWRARALAATGANGGPWSQTFSFATGTIQTALPGMPTLLSPANESVDLDPVLSLRWTPAVGAAMHLVQISDDSTFAIGAREFGSFDGMATAALEQGRRWWWRARGVNEVGAGPWSEVWSFTTSITPAPVASPATSSTHSIRIVPTPATTSATLAAQVAPGSEVRLRIASMRGEIVHEQSARADAAGSIAISLPVDRLAAGIYRCRITTTTGESFDAPLLVTR